MLSEVQTLRLLNGKLRLALIFLFFLLELFILLLLHLFVEVLEQNCKEKIHEDSLSEDNEPDEVKSGADVLNSSVVVEVDC